MATPVEDIRIFNIARTEIDCNQVDEWLEHLGVDLETFQRPDNLTSAEELIGLAGKRCYMSFQLGLNPNVNKIREDWDAYLSNILVSSHGSVLEHATYSFAIEGASRVFTAEMNRHRAGVAISEGSMRYIRFEDIPYWLPHSIRLTDEEKEMAAALGITADGGVGDKDSMLIWKKLATQEIFAKAFDEDQKNYAALQEIWREELSEGSKFHSKKQITSAMRRVIGIGVSTGGVWTTNIRALRHIITMRATEQAEEEILYVATTIAKYIVEREKILFGDFVETDGFWKPENWKI